MANRNTLSPDTNNAVDCTRKNLVVLVSGFVRVHVPHLGYLAVTYPGVNLTPKLSWPSSNLSALILTVSFSIAAHQLYKCSRIQRCFGKVCIACC